MSGTGSIQGLNRERLKTETIVTVPIKDVRLLERLGAAKGDPFLPLDVQDYARQQSIPSLADNGMAWDDLGAVRISLLDLSGRRDPVVEVRGTAVETSASMAARLRIEMAEGAKENMREAARLARRESTMLREAGALAAAQAEIDLANAVIKREDEMAGTIRQAKDNAARYWRIAWRMTVAGGVLGGMAVLEGLALLHWL